MNEKIKKSSKENTTIHSKIRTTRNVIIHTGHKPITYQSDAKHSDIYIFIDFDGVFILMVIMSLF